MNTVTLIHDDCKVALRRLIDEGVRVHSIVTDPPYGLVSIRKRFGGSQAPARTEGNDGSFARLSGGFMGKAWDATGIELDVELWRLCLEILLPGGYLLAFSSPRTGHRMACAIEDAGFIMHPFIGWAYGSGFPKAHAADKAIDKALGKKGGYGAPKSAAHAGWIDRGAMRGDEGHEGWQRPWMADPEALSQAARQYVPAAEEAAQWSGWAYGGQARKPALEPIYVAQKPFSERNGALNILKHGVGAVNIDGCRVPADGRPLRVGDYKDTDATAYSGRMDGSLAGGSKAVGTTDLGRHPANLIHDGSPEVVAQFPDSKGQQGDVRGTEPSRTGDENTVCYGEFGRVAFTKRDDGGSAARFFECYRPLCYDCGDSGFVVVGTGWDNDMHPEACPSCEGRSTAPQPFDDQTIFYHSKAARADRAGSKHPTVKPIGLLQALVRHVTPPGGTVLDPFAGTGTTAEAARREGADSVLIEFDPEYAADIERRFGIETPAHDYLRMLGVLS